MMSKERELLERLLVSGIFDSGLYKDWEQYIQELLAQPEQDNIQYLLDQVARLTAENAMLKEKWLAPQKREPLSNVQLSKIWKEKYKTGFNAIEYYLFAELFRDAEKAHGIGGGE